MKTPIRLHLLLFVATTTLPLAVQAQLEWGRDVDPERSFSLYLTAGQVTSLDGTVEETKRAYTDEIGAEQDYGHFLQSYSLKELGFDSSYALFGISLEKQWSLFTFRLDGSYMNPTASGVAEDEPYALGVNKVEYNGNSYDYMLIPQGGAYSADIQGGIVNLQLDFTPICLKLGENTTLTPWLHAGIVALGGEYEIDAGPAQSVITYESYPYPYVVGGTGTGYWGGLLPEYGFGGEVKITLGSRKGSPIDLRLQGTFSMLEFNGSTASLGLDTRNDKNIDLSYDSLELRAFLDVPLSEKTDIVLGVTYRTYDAETTVEAQDKTAAEQAAAMEKYDKYGTFKLDSINVMVGLAF